MNLSDISVIKSVLGRYGFSFSKSLGQNFLINPSVCPRMAELCGADEKSGVIEIGPGIGVLTRELSKRAKKVVAIELDKRLIPVLDETLSECSNVKVINGDVMDVDLKALIDDEFSGIENVFICANLPYYITSPVIMKLLESRLPIKAVTVMVQKEAAERICAGVGTRECGAVTAAVCYYSIPEKLFDVSRGSFMPAPNVDSQVIRLNVRETPAVKIADEKFFFKVVRASFMQRRKTLANSLASGLSLPKKVIISAISDTGLSVTARAEELSLEEFARLSEQIKETNT